MYFSKKISGNCRAGVPALSQGFSAALDCTDPARQYRDINAGLLIIVAAYRRGQPRAAGRFGRLHVSCAGHGY